MMGKVLTGELSCQVTGLVFLYSLVSYNFFHITITFFFKYQHIDLAKKNSVFSIIKMTPKI